MNQPYFYPIGTAGQPWGPAELTQWRARQVRQRSYADDVLSRVERLRERFDVSSYGEVAYAGEHFPLMAMRSRDWHVGLPCVLVTGGVHGYETSGVHGALRFVEQHAQAYAGQVNLLVVPCVSPWAFERIQRWNYDAIDPNRSFFEASPAQESAALMRLVAPLRGQWVAHIDLHETTDTDASEYLPAVAARDGKPHVPHSIPDGFYLVDDAANPQPAFQQAIVEAVARVSHTSPRLTRKAASSARRWWRMVLFTTPCRRWACVRASPARGTPPPPRFTPTAPAPRPSNALQRKWPPCVPGWRLYAKPKCEL